MAPRPGRDGRHMWGRCLVSGASGTHTLTGACPEPTRTEPPWSSTRQRQSFATPSVARPLFRAIEGAR
jgi:hypothetical protein